MNKRKHPARRGSSGKSAAKAILLPLTLQSIRERSLRCHLALEALRAGSGNGHLLSELIHVLYVAWYLQEAGFGTADATLYAHAEQALERSAARATGADVWRLEDAEALALERLLALHDQQLQETPVKVIRDVHKRLARFAQSDRTAPWQKNGPVILR
jgi:hypothetical protein